MLDLKWLVPCTFDHSKPDCMTRLVITTASWCLRAQCPFSWCSTQRDQNESLFCSNRCWIELERSPVGCGTWWHRDILLDQSRVWSQGLWESCCGPARWAGKVLAAGCPIFQRLFQQPNAIISANFSQFQPISANFSQFFKFKNDFPSGAPWDGSNFWAVCPFRLYKTE